jgi:hypothetical protein
MDADRERMEELTWLVGEILREADPLAEKAEDGWSNPPLKADTVGSLGARDKYCSLIQKQGADLAGRSQCFSVSSIMKSQPWASGARSLKGR